MKIARAWDRPKKRKGPRNQTNELRASAQKRRRSRLIFDRFQVEEMLRKQHEELCRPMSCGHAFAEMIVVGLPIVPGVPARQVCRACELAQGRTHG